MKMLTKHTENIFILIIIQLFLNVDYIKAGEKDDSSSHDLDNTYSNTEATAEDSQSEDKISDTRRENDTDQDTVKMKMGVEPQSSRNKKKLKYYFMASIQKRGTHFASGAVVDTKWILSVAELFYNVRESINLYNARLGSFNCKKGGIVVPLKEIEIHPRYKYRLPNFDLALLRIPKIDTEIANYVHPIKLATFGEDQIRSNKFWSTYWTRLIVNGYILPQSATERYKPNTMRVSPQELIPRGHCKDLLNLSKTTLNNSSMCLEPIASFHSRCMPDAGAPIVSNKYLWAITSGWTSSDCLTKTSPIIATEVSSKFVRPWLKLVLNIRSSFEEE